MGSSESITYDKNGNEIVNDVKKINSIKPILETDRTISERKNFDIGKTFGLGKISDTNSKDIIFSNKNNLSDFKIHRSSISKKSGNKCQSFQNDVFIPYDSTKLNPATIMG